ncbi:MAG: tetraacyldisaccharide 4'-kinase [Siculibacillus sp.]|nr:tetraacyldisaccharide 4'-kinase [Siculibacillus sp.]
MIGRQMRAPDFWTSGGVAATALAPIAAIWGLLAGTRMRRRPSVLAPVPVIAVGNFTAGGAGKTPTTATLVGLARRAGFSPAVMTRGYGGDLAGPVRVDASRHGADEVGDEALLHAALAPTIVARDRTAGLALLAECGADLVILDDGFQNPTLAKDLSLVVVDRGHGIGNGRVMPAGPLRAPLAVQLDLASALVVVDSGEAEAPGLAALLAEADRRRLPVLSARLVLEAPERLAGRRVLAWAGIGRPEKFAATLAAAGVDVVELVAFGDHQRLEPADAEDLLARAEARGLDLVTTEKDVARLAGRMEPALMRLALAVRVASVDLVFDDEAAVSALIAELHRPARR